MFESSNRLKTRVKGRLLVALLSTQEGKEVRPAKVHQVQRRCLWQLLLLSGASKRIQGIGKALNSIESNLFSKLVFH